LIFYMERSEEKDTPDTWLDDVIRKGYIKFCEALDDDFNTAGALGSVFEIVRDLNNYLKDSASLDKNALINAKKFFDAE